MTRGGSPAWRLGEEVTVPHRKKQLVMNYCYTGPRTWVLRTYLLRIGTNGGTSWTRFHKRRKILD